MNTVAPDTPAQRRRLALRDGPSAVAGIGTALVFHVLILLFGLRAGAREGNVARARDEHTLEAPDEPEQRPLETLLVPRGGGGIFDPRRVHRAPMLATNPDAPAPGLTKNQNPTRADSTNRTNPNPQNPDRNLSPLVTHSEAERLRFLQALERESEQNAPPGAGVANGTPDASGPVVPDVSRSALGKVRSFISPRVRVTREGITVRVVVTLDAGGSVSSGRLVRRSDDESVNADVALALASLVEGHAAVPGLSDEEKAALAGRPIAINLSAGGHH